MEPSTDTVLERRLTFWRRVCGCQVGALCAIAALAWYIFLYEDAAASTLVEVLRGVAVVIGAGIAGKAAAIIVARTVLMTIELRRQQTLTR
jgi:L-cysteine desulfidase